MQPTQNTGESREERSTRAQRSARQQLDSAAGTGQNLVPSGRSGANAPAAISAAALSNRSGHASTNRAPKEQSKEEKKQGRWTAEEKAKFVEALKLYGKDWKKVESHIKTRSGAQIRSHAQKFFLNIERTKGLDIDQYIAQVQSEEGGMVTPIMSVTANVSQVPNQEQSFHIENSSNIDPRGENRSMGSISQAGQSAISDVSHAKQLHINQNVMSQFRNKPQTSVKKTEGQFSEHFNASQFDPANNMMMHQNSAVKGAMSLLNQAQLIGGNKQKLRLSPTKFKNPTTGLNQHQLNQQRQQLNQAMAKGIQQNSLSHEFESRIRTYAQEKVDLDHGCWLLIDQLSLGPLQLDFQELWSLNPNQRVTYGSQWTQTLAPVQESAEVLAMPSQLADLQLEINNYGLGAYNRVVINKIQSGFHSQIDQGPAQEIPTIVLSIAESGPRGAQQHNLTQIVNLHTNQVVKQFQMTDGTMIAFGSNFQDNYKIESPSPTAKRLMLLTFGQSPTEANYKGASARNMGKTPSFGGIHMPQLAQGQMFGLNFADSRPQQNQIGNLNLSSIAANYNLSLLAGQQGLNRGVRNMGIGPQGRDRACSTQSGFMTGPSLKQQADDQRKSKLLLSKLSEMLKNKQQKNENSQRVQPQAHDNTPQSTVDVANFAKAFMASTKPPELGMSRSYNPQAEQLNPPTGLINMLKPLMNKQSQKSQSQIQSRNSPQIQHPQTNPNDNITNLLQNVNLIKQFNNKKEQEHKKEENGKQLLANITTMLKSMRQEPKQPIERSQTVSPEQVMQAMLSAKGPSFPGRGISEISRQSQVSRQQDYGSGSRLGLTGSKQIGGTTSPFVRIPSIIGQRNSGEEVHNNPLSNQKVRGLPLQPKFSRRPSHGSNPSSTPTPSVNPGEGAHGLHLAAPKPTARNGNAEVKEAPQPQPHLQQAQLPSISEPPPPQTIDNSAQIEQLEFEKQATHLNFLTDLSSHMLFIHESESEEFVHKYVDLFTKIQNKFLELFNHEMSFYVELHRKKPPVDDGQLSIAAQKTEEKTIKKEINFINKAIVRNMIEVINIQICLKIISHLLTESKGARRQRENMVRLQELSPIELKIFNSIIPSTYKEGMKEKMAEINEEQMKEEKLNQQDVKEDTQEQEKQKVGTVTQKDANQQKQAQGNQVRQPGQESSLMNQPRGEPNPTTQAVAEAVNQINTSTFQQIAHSLSPEPEQLLSQQIGLPLKEVAKSIAAIGSKRACNQTDDPEPGAQGHKRQRTKIEEEPGEGKDEAGRQKMYPGKIIDNSQNVDEVIQGLLQQYQDSQMSSAHNHGATRMSRSASLIAEGVRAGGFRQAAYSDSHQELVKTVQSMSAADIQILSSAQKGALAYRAQLKPQNQQVDPLLEPSPSPGVIHLHEIGDQPTEELRQDGPVSNVVQPTALPNPAPTVTPPTIIRDNQNQNPPAELDLANYQGSSLIFDDYPNTNNNQQPNPNDQSPAAPTRAPPAVQQSTETSPPKARSPSHSQSQQQPPQNPCKYE